MKGILQKINKLIDLKSILTLMLTVYLCWGFQNDKIDSKEFLILVTMCFNFFFNYQNNKINANAQNNTNSTPTNEDNIDDNINDNIGGEKNISTNYYYSYNDSDTK